MRIEVDREILIVGAVAVLLMVLLYMWGFHEGLRENRRTNEIIRTQISQVAAKICAGNRK